MYLNYTHVGFLHETFCISSNSSVIVRSKVQLTTEMTFFWVDDRTITRHFSKLQSVISIRYFFALVGYHALFQYVAYRVLIWSSAQSLLQSTKLGSEI